MFREMRNLGDDFANRLIDSDKTLKHAEEHEGVNISTLEILALALSKKLREIRRKYPDSPLLDPLKSPELGWILHRLLSDIDPIIKHEYLIMNHEYRYLVEHYNIHLTVCPCKGRIVNIKRAGLEDEQFPYDDIAHVRYELIFSEHNHRRELGFNLGYGTHEGRIELLKPDAEMLEDDKAYRIHRQTARCLPDPRHELTHLFELIVYGGYRGQNQMAHFTLAQPAIYRHLSFTLDLTAYPKPFVKEPELIIVPVLKDRPFNCCEIARDGRGLPMKPDKLIGRVWSWNFTGLRDVMIGVHWKLDEELIPEDYEAPNLPMILAMSRST